MEAPAEVRASETTAELEGQVAAEIDREIRESDAALEAELEAEQTADPSAGLVPGVADGRFAEVDDGIDDLFAVSLSERMFGGATPPFPIGSSVMLYTDIAVRYGITRDARARVDWGFAYTTSHVAGDFADTMTTSMHYDAQVERVEARNPVLTVEWAPVIGSTRFSFGAGVAAPTAAGENVPTNVDLAPAYDASILAHDLMLATAGGLSPWRYRRERFGVFIPLAFSFPLEQITITIEGAAAIAAPVTGAGRNVPVTGDLQADVQISGDVIPELRLGARFAIALLAIGANAAPGTIVQPSATGFARLRLDPGFLEASVLADLGGYYGLGSAGGVWSVTVGGGVTVP